MPTKRKPPHKLVKIRYSCLTGQAVWVCHKLSYVAEWTAYKRACLREMARVENWKHTAEARKSAVLGFLDACMAGQPAVGDLPPEKKDAARRLLAIANAPYECYRAFYDHIVEERRRKSARKSGNRDYGKQERAT